LTSSSQQLQQQVSKKLVKHRNLLNQNHGAINNIKSDSKDAIKRSKKKLIGSNQNQEGEAVNVSLSAW
jgi:ribosome recycling factor